jgi:hypothetical protein
MRRSAVGALWRPAAALRVSSQVQAEIWSGVGRARSGGFSVDKSQAKRFCYEDFGWRVQYFNSLA